MKPHLLAAMMAELAMVAVPRRERTFLMERGWLPLGMGSNGHEGWGKMIDGKAKCIDEPEALRLEGWSATPPTPEVPHAK